MRVRRSNGFAAAARALSGGAAEAVPAGNDGSSSMSFGTEVADRTAGALLDRKLEHLIEIAVVEGTVPSDRHHGPAHQALDGERVVCGDDLVHVRVVVAGIKKEFEKAADGHVRD